MRTSSVANETESLMKIRLRGFEQDITILVVENVKLFCVINPINVNITRPIKNLIFPQEIFVNLSI